MNQPYEVTFSMQLATSETSPNRQNCFCWSFWRSFNV